LKQALSTTLEHAVAAILARADDSDVNVPEIQLEVPRNPEHGDFSTNVALVLAKQMKMAPRDLAAAIVAELQTSDLLTQADTAGPGFINLRIATDAFMRVIADVHAAGVNYGRSDIGAGQRVQIEFVSANPTGPLHVGHGRGAAYGAVLANIMSACGYTVEREYYVNDAGRQMDILAASLLLRYLETGGSAVTLPANAYQGDYITAMAGKLHRTAATDFACVLPASEPQDDPELALDQLIADCKTALGAERYRALHRFARDEILAGIETDLATFGVEFDHWFSESALADDGRIARAVANLSERGHVDNRDGAQWFASTAFGDEKDRVIVRDNGTPTYFASDVAYHQDKYARGYDRMINIWGADHHGYITRVKASIEALGLDPERLEILLVQFAALYRNGEKVAMSTRSGQFVTLAELVDEVGRDAARFFYITRRSDQHLDFDLDLAKSQSNDNPVYYVQYAHARICSVLTQLEDKGLSFDIDAGIAATARLDEPGEKQLAVQLLRYPEVLAHAVQQREPHQITNYLRELAADFHGYYNGTRLLTDDTELRNARLALALAVRQVLGNGLELLGVSAPEAM
jgi:arginyl-tRNA synthetase